MLISPETAKSMTASQEISIIGNALRANPNNTKLRFRLAKLYNEIENFAATIALLIAPSITAPDFHALLLLARAYLAHGDATLARQTAQLAFAQAHEDYQRATALVEQAKALFRLKQPELGRDLLSQALALDPANLSACERLAHHLLRAGAPEAALALTDELASKGIKHTALLAARMLALAKIGDSDGARATLGNGAFGYCGTLSAPTGWASLAEFNVSLVEELASHPDIRRGRHGTASRNTWRIEQPAQGAAPAARALLASIAKSAAQHAATLSSQNHPWLLSRPRNAFLKSWCVMVDGDGFEAPHIHASGWMSGVYYAQVPESVARGTDDRGCIAFGLPAELVGEEAARAFGVEIMRPQAGLLMLFPSHRYHYTFPHGGTERRCCFAFDIVPGVEG
jgi:tetratricopeptide (TPR) repeat protein